MGTKKSLKGTVSVEHIGNRIRLRWRYQKERYSLNLFSFNKANLLKAKNVALVIEADMENGSFDFTKSKYLEHPPDNIVPRTQAEPVIQKQQNSIIREIESLSVQSTQIRVDLVEKFEYWVKQYRNMDCDRDIDYYSTRNMMKKWEPFSLEEVVSRMNKETFGGRTYNRRLNLLKAFFNWAFKAKICPYNPLDDVLPKKTKKVVKKERMPFSEDEIRQVLTAFREDAFSKPSSGIKHSHYYPFVYFIFKTGVRNAEAIGLRVKHVLLDKNLIHIKESLARSIKGTNAAARVRKETKNGKERFLPLTNDLREVLMLVLKGKDSDDLVFQSPRGSAIDDHMFQKRIFKPILKNLGIENRNLYACRHTFNSRCIESGMTPVMAAFLMGNNPETALRNYTHLLQLPTRLPEIIPSEERDDTTP